MDTILITGANGLVGKHLCKRLKEKGYNVTVLSRSKSQYADYRTFYWSLERIENEAIETADYIVHLAGANIGEKRWSAKRKQLIIDSRVKTANLIFNKVKELNKNLKAFISASAVGYYGAVTSDRIFTETDPPANDFLGNTCRLWEQTANSFKDLGIRTVKIRTGVVLAKQGGALAQMITPFKIGMGAAIGTGKQYLPWIHIDDLCGIYLKAIEDAVMSGAYNAAAPHSITNEEFTYMLARILKKSIVLPNIPSFMMKLIFGEMAELLLSGSRISSEKIESAGYRFLFPNLEKALTGILVND